jgi:hypothetical protein
MAPLGEMDALTVFQALFLPLASDGETGSFQTDFQIGFEDAWKVSLELIGVRGFLHIEAGHEGHRRGAKIIVPERIPAQEVAHETER